MRAALLSLSLLALLVPTAAAQVDKEALRKAAQLPSVSVQFNFGIDPVRGWVVGFDKPDRAAEIKAVRANMKGDASDAERYFELGFLLPDKKDWTAALTKAKELYRDRLAMKPDDGHLLARLGMTLWELDENKEAEELVRKAVQKAPDDWRCWSALGDLLDGKSGDALPYKKGSRLSMKGLGMEAMVTADLFDGKPSAEQLALARKLRGEARACFDKAVALAPREPQAYLDRAKSAAYRGMFEFVVQNVGKKSPAGTYLKMMTAPEVIADLQKAAELEPRNCQVVALTAIFSVAALALRAKDAEPGVAEQVAAVALQKAEKSLRAVMKDKDARRAAEASVMLGTLFLVIKGFDDTEEAQGLFRRGIELDPDNLMAWDLIIGVAVKKGEDEAAAELCEKRLKRQDSAKYRFMLAKVYDLLAKPDQAETHLRAGLKSYPDDPACNLGLAVILLKRGDAAALKQATEQLDRAEKLLQKTPGSYLREDCDTTRAILIALEGNPEEARARLRKVLEKDEGHDGAKKALEILSK